MDLQGIFVDLQGLFVCQCASNVTRHHSHIQLCRRKNLRLMIVSAQLSKQRMMTVSVELGGKQSHEMGPWMED